MRISPAFTAWPPNRFTPSRWALESRPFRELEAPFLCAIGTHNLPRSLLLQGHRASGSLLLKVTVFQGHCVSGSPGNVGDLDAGQMLAMTLALVVTGLILELVDPDLGSLGLRDNLAT